MREIMAKNPQFEPLIMQHLQALQQAMQPPPGAGQKPPTISYAFKGQDLIDPQIRDVFDKVTGEPPLQPNSPLMGPGAPLMAQGPMGIPGPMGRPTPQGPQAPGGGQTMTNSNRNSTATSIIPRGNAPSGPRMGPS